MAEKNDEKRNEFIEAYRHLSDPNKYFKRILIPLVLTGIFIFILPYLLDLLNVLINIDLLLFYLGGAIPIVLAILYPYILWKNKEVEINENMHFLITHLRVLSLAEMGLKDVIKLIGGKKEYGALGEEFRKISVLTTQWKSTLENAFRFIADRTPSKILRDFLDRFSQAIASGVGHREFIEREQESVMEDYKTMYESSNNVITILNEIYVAMLTSIAFLMVFGIISPMITGLNVNTYVYTSSFVLIAAEACLLYFVYSFIPKDSIWHKLAKKSDREKQMRKTFYYSILISIILGVILLFLKFFISSPMIAIIPYEILATISLTPLIVPGFYAIKEEDNIARREKNFMGFLPNLGSIAAMRRGKIIESLGYLSEKDYGILTEQIKRLYKRLKTRISGKESWEWFGAETNSNLIQRFSEMFREASQVAADPHKSSRMIVENMRKVRDLRFKKLTILKTTNSLFYGITLGITLTIYISLIIARHIGNATAQMGAVFENLQRTTGLGGILPSIPSEVFSNVFLIIFIVLLLHSFIMALTIKVLRGSHRLSILFYFVIMSWIVSLTAAATRYFLTGLFGL